MFARAASGGKQPAVITSKGAHEQGEGVFPVAEFFGYGGLSSACIDDLVEQQPARLFYAHGAQYHPGEIGVYVGA